MIFNPTSPSGYRYLLWLLVRPPEAGGLGMPPADAKRLTIGEALFYLKGEDAMKSECRRMNRLAHFGKLPTDDEIRAAHQAEMVARRKFFTGSDELAVLPQEE